jgi:ATP-dependent helicase/nuclease subunit A
MLGEMDLPVGLTPLVVWPVKGSSSLTPIQAAKAEVEARETEERNRLLYVALTRPRDRLYIAGAQARDKLPAGCWYDVVTRALEPHLTTIESADGTTVRRIETPQTAPPEPRRAHLSGAGLAAPRPAWMTLPAPREVQPAIPIAPSRLAPYDFDDSGEPQARPVLPTDARAEQTTVGPQGGSPNRFLRGTLTHALLQHLPGLPPATWATAARAFLDQRASDLPLPVRRSMASETLAILNDSTFSALFGPSSLAEVPIVAELPNPSGKGLPVRLHGQIDRLVETPDAVLLIDYKTNRDAPTTLDGVAEAYLVQLAAYRVALAAIFPDKPVRAALLWTETAQLMEVPQATLADYGARLWELGLAKGMLASASPS